MAIKLDNSKFVRNLVKGHKLVPHLDNALGKGEFNWEAKFESKQADDAFHPSGDCVPTAHQLYTKATAYADTTVSASMLKTYTVGHFWHAYIQHIVVEKLHFANWQGIERQKVKRWAAGPYGSMRGAADIAPCSIPVHGDYLVDIKTMGGHDYRQNGLPKWCAPKYECQVNVYMDWFDLEKCIILCVSKDSPHDFKEFLFERNQPLIDAIYAKWQLVKDCYDASIEPDPSYDPNLPLLGPRL